MKETYTRKGWGNLVRKRWFREEIKLHVGQGRRKMSQEDICRNWLLPINVACDVSENFFVVNEAFPYLPSSQFFSAIHYEVRQNEIYNDRKVATEITISILMNCTSHQW